MGTVISRKRKTTSFEVVLTRALYLSPIVTSSSMVPPSEACLKVIIAKEKTHLAVSFSLNRVARYFPRPE